MDDHLHAFQEFYHIFLGRISGYILSGNVSGRDYAMELRSGADVGQCIRAARKLLGLTQAELGARIGASQKWVSTAENGTGKAEVGTILRCLRALDVRLDATMPGQAAVSQVSAALRKPSRSASGTASLPSPADIPIVNIDDLLPSGTAERNALRKWILEGGPASYPYSEPSTPDSGTAERPAGETTGKAPENG